MLTWIKTHGVWLVLIGLGLVFFHSWLAEHDARLRSDAQVTISETNAAALQKQIAVNAQTVAALQKQIADNDARASVQVQALAAAVAKVKTTPQAAEAISTMTEAKVQPVAQGDGSMTITAPQVIPLLDELAQGKQAGINLAACQADLASTRQIVTTDESSLDASRGIITQKDAEIASLKRKPSFWRRVGSTLKQVGVGIGIGLTLSRTL